MLWSTCKCFLKSYWSSTLNDIHHRNFFALHKNHVMVNVNMFSQVVVVFNSEWHSIHELFCFHKNHVMVNVQVFSQVVVSKQC